MKLLIGEINRLLCEPLNLELVSEDGINYQIKDRTSPLIVNKLESEEFQDLFMQAISSKKEERGYGIIPARDSLTIKPTL